MSLISDALRRRDEDGDDQPSKPAGLSLAAKKTSAPPEQTTRAPKAAPVTSPAAPAPYVAPPVEKTGEPAAPVTEPPRLILKSNMPKPEAEDAVAPLEEEARIAARQPKKRKHKAWLELLVVLTVLVILVFGGVALYYYLNPGGSQTRVTGSDEVSSLPPPSPVAQPEKAQPPIPEPAAAPVEVVPSSKPFSATREVLALAETRATETDEVVGEIEPASPSEPEETAQVSGAEKPVEKSVVEERQSSPSGGKTEAERVIDPAPPAEALAPPPVIWPGFSLQAAMGSGKRGSVMIDGSIIRVGESHGALNIIEITPGGVLIEYLGERRVFRVKR